MSHTVGVWMNDINKLCVCGVQPLTRWLSSVQGACWVKACKAKPCAWHRFSTVQLAPLSVGSCPRRKRTGRRKGLPVILPSVPSNICPTKPEICAPRLTPIMCKESSDAPSTWDLKVLMVTDFRHVKGVKNIRRRNVNASPHLSYISPWCIALW